MKNQCLEVVLLELESAGIVPNVEKSGKHLKIRWPGRQMIVAKTTSDRRAEMNNRALVRRLLRADGRL